MFVSFRLWWAIGVCTRVSLVNDSDQQSLWLATIIPWNWIKTVSRIILYFFFIPHTLTCACYNRVELKLFSPPPHLHVISSIIMDWQSTKMLHLSVCLLLITLLSTSCKSTLYFLLSLIFMLRFVSRSATWLNFKTRRGLGVPSAQWHPVGYLIFMRYCAILAYPPNVFPPLILLIHAPDVDK